MAATVAKPTRAILDSILGMASEAQASVVPAFALTHKMKQEDFYDLLAEREDEIASEKLVKDVVCEVSGGIPEAVADILMTDPTKRLVFTFKRDEVSRVVKGEDGKDKTVKTIELVQVATVQTARGRKAKAK